MITIAYGRTVSQSGSSQEIWGTMHDPSLGDESYMVDNAVVTQSIDEIDALTFDIYPNNHFYADMEAFAGRVHVDDTETEAREFDGRVIGVVPTMDDNGRIYKHVTCEACESFLLDQCIDTTAFATSGTLIGDDVYRMDAADFLQEVFDQYNAQCYPTLQVYLGDVDLPTGTTYDVPWTYGTNARDLLRDFINTVNATNNHIDGVHVVYYQLFTLYVHRNANDSAYVCDIVDYWNNSTEGTIALGSNMGAVSSEPDYTDMVNCIMPLGDEYTNGNGIKYRLRLQDYLAVYGTPSAAMQQQFSFSGDEITYLHTEPSQLLVRRPLLLEGLSTADEDGNPTISSDQANTFITRSLVYLSSHNDPKTSVSVTAYDLSLINENFNRFGLFQNWDISHPLLSMSENLPVVKRTIDVNNPANSSIEFGAHAPRETDFKNSESKTLEKVAAATGVADYASGSVGSSVGTSAGSGTNYVGSTPKSGGGTTIIEGGGDVSLTQYIPNWDSGSGAKPSSTGIIADFETPVFFKFQQQFYASDLQVPARTIAPLMVVVFYIGILWQVGYSDTRIGNILARVAGKWAQESHDGLFGLPTTSFQQAYTALKNKDEAGTLTWEDVAPYVEIGAIAYRKDYSWPWVCAMPFIITGAEYYASSAWGSSGNVVLDCKPSTAFQWFNSTVQHPTEGAVEVAWVLACANATLLNPTSSAHGAHSSDSLKFRGFSVNNDPPEGADPGSSIDAGVMGALHDNTYGQTTITPQEARHISRWGCCMLFREIDDAAQDQGNVTSTSLAALGRNIDTGATVNLDTTVYRFIQ